MNVRILLASVILLVPYPCVCKNAAYDAALCQATYKGQWDLAKMLIENGADINCNVPPLSTPLINSVDRCGLGPDDSKAALEFVRYLIAKGVNVSATDQHSATAMMFADRVGSSEMTSLLKSAGALLFDPADPMTKAVLIRIDARCLAFEVNDYHIMFDGRTNETQIDFARLESPMLFPDVTIRKWPVTFKVWGNKGVDLLGNAYILRPLEWNSVWINPKTVEALDAVVKKEFWKGFLPDE